jgi:hypothetical protein
MFFLDYSEGVNDIDDVGLAAELAGFAGEEGEFALAAELVAEVMMMYWISRRRLLISRIKLEPCQR